MNRVQWCSVAIAVAAVWGCATTAPLGTVAAPVSRDVGTAQWWHERNASHTGWPPKDWRPR